MREKIANPYFCLKTSRRICTKCEEPLLPTLALQPVYFSSYVRSPKHSAKLLQLLSKDFLALIKHNHGSCEKYLKNYLIKAAI